MAVEKVAVFLLVGVIGVVLGSGFPCYDNLQCVAGSSLTSPYPHDKCTPEWGAFPRVNGETNELIARHLKTSLEYLLIANHFKDWKYHRPGFVNYFSKLSEDNWNEGLSLMLHMVERGGTLLKDFKIDMPGPGDATTQYQLKEVEALSRALDMEPAQQQKPLIWRIWPIMALEFHMTLSLPTSWLNDFTTTLSSALSIWPTIWSFCRISSPTPQSTLPTLSSSLIQSIWNNFKLNYNYYYSVYVIVQKILLNVMMLLWKIHSFSSKFYYLIILSILHFHNITLLQFPCT